MKKNLSKNIFYMAVLPLLCAFGMFFFRGKFYSWASVSVAVFACGAFFISFEKRGGSSHELVITAAMTAVSIFGRIAFAGIPGFKPCTAVIIITAVYFGRETGFMAGALTALVSNFYFGQGTWTPFQMLIWGLTGYLAGIASEKLLKNSWLMVIFSAVSGIAFSLIMDLWSVVWEYNNFILSKYLAYVVSSGFYTVEYAVSNVIFVFILKKPFGRFFKRLNQKYGIGMEAQK